jgi:hypothetical protein
MSDFVLETASGNSGDSATTFRPSAWYSVNLPLQRGVDFTYDESVEWPFAVMGACGSLIFAFGFAMSVALGLVGWETGVPGVLIATFLTSAAVHIVASLAFILFNGNWFVCSSILFSTPQVCALELGIKIAR